MRVLSVIKFVRKNFEKLFFKKWIIGICKDDIKNIIRTKSFDPDIHWFFGDSTKTYYADPFLYHSSGDHIKILLEEYSFKEDYGKLSLLTIDKDYNQVEYKGILDTKSHLSYPFWFIENNKSYMFPEAGQSGKLPCYQFDPVSETVEFVKDIIDMPLRDSTIIKHNNKYWLFGTLSEFSANSTKYELLVFYSDNLLGPYTPHRQNPIKDGLDGTRSAGNFIEVDGVIYRPTQNCKKQYGDSMTINKIVEMNEESVVEEPYFTIYINNKTNKRMETIHTINELNGYIVVDSIKSTFAPLLQMKTKINRHKRREK